MKRCLVLVEGQTEEQFVNQVLMPYLRDRSGFLVVKPVIVKTSRPARGPMHRGGGLSWIKLRDELRLLTRDHSALVTTMVDYYGLPRDVPGFGDGAVGGDPRAHAATIEGEIGAELARPNLIPNIVVHEFETMLYADPAIVAEVLAVDDLARSMERDLLDCGEPELVDDGYDSAPGRRLGRYVQGFSKLSDGPRAAQQIGLDRIRARCPHLDEWIVSIESWARGDRSA